MIGKYINHLIIIKHIILELLEIYEKLKLGNSFSINLLQRNT